MGDGDVALPFRHVREGKDVQLSHRGICQHSLIPIRIAQLLFYQLCCALEAQESYQHL